MLLDDVYTHLISVSDWDATNMFKAYMPEDPDTCLALFEYAGQPQYTLGGGSSAYDQVRLGVQVRSETYKDARTKIEALQSLLESVSGQTLGSTHYMRIMCYDTPVPLQPDEKDRQRMSLNFSVMKERG